MVYTEQAKKGRRLGNYQVDGLKIKVGMANRNGLVLKWRNESISTHGSTKCIAPTGKLHDTDESIRP